jgi:hypothetical protein
MLTDCPVCDWVAEKQLKRNSHAAKMQTQGRSKAEIDKALEVVDEWLKNFNVEKFFQVNVMKPDGTVGKLKLKISAKKEVERLIDDNRKNGFKHPISKDGLFLDFKRTGSGRFDTKYAVEISKEMLTDSMGKKSFSFKEHTLTPELIARVAKEAFDLTKSYRSLSYDQLKLLVSSNADPKVVDSVLGAPKVASTETAEEPAYDEPGDASELNDVDTEALLLAQAEKFLANTPTVAKPVTQSVAPVQAKTMAVDETAEFDDFIKSLKV